MVHKRVIQLLEAIVQRGRVDLSEMLGYFALASPFTAQLEHPLISHQSGLTSWQTWRE